LEHHNGIAIQKTLCVSSLI